MSGLNLLHKRKNERDDNTLGGRSNYLRDYQAIIHSEAFRRLRHKTQVFFLAEDDTVCTRIEHVLTVASIGSTICKQLKLDDELASAIGVGHDLGHAPFGHAGEKALGSLTSDGNFTHEIHGVRIVDYIERRGAGLNLTFAVRDGIAHHSGESHKMKISPRKNALNLESLYRNDLLPATLEGCVVRLSDRIAFIGRDLVDAVHAGIIKSSEIPRDPLNKVGCIGTDPDRDPMDFNSKVINYFVTDIVRSSDVKNNIIRLSDTAQNVMEKLYKFSSKTIYNDDYIRRNFKNVEKIIKTIYQEFSDLYDQYDYQPDKYKKHIPDLNARASAVGHLGMFMEDHEKVYLEMESSERKSRLLVDFIATFADNEAIRAFQDLVHPKKLV